MESTQALNHHVRAAEEQIVALRDTITKRREQTSQQAPQTTPTSLNSGPEIPLTNPTPPDSTHTNEAAGVGTDLPDCTSSNNHDEQESPAQQDSQADKEVALAPDGGLPTLTSGTTDKTTGGTSMAGDHITDEHEPFQNEMSNITTRMDSALRRNHDTGSAIDLTQPELSNDGLPQDTPRANPSAPSTSHGVETLANENVIPNATSSIGMLQSLFGTSQSDDTEMTELNSAPAFNEGTANNGEGGPLNFVNTSRPAAAMHMEFRAPVHIPYHFPQAQKRPREPSFTMWGPARVCRPRIQTDNANLTSITPRSSLSTVYSPMERVGADGLTDAERERLLGYMRLMGGMGGLPLPY